MMKNSFLLLCILFSLSAHAEDKSVTIKKSLLTNFSDCHYIAHLYQPSNIDGTHLGLCINSHTDVRGIFSATACVVTLIVPETQTRNPFYGDKGHWGTEGKCDATKMREKLLEAQTLTTQNPITKIKDLISQGWKLETIKDFGKISQTIEKLIQK